MLQVRCIERIKNKRGVITQYVLQDEHGNNRTISSNELKVAIRNKKLNCINLTLTSDNRLIEKQGNSYSKENETTSDVEKYKAYLAKHTILGRHDATFTVENGRVLLKEILIREGTFTIPEFVSGFTKKVTKTFERVRGIDRPVYVNHVLGLCTKLKIINKSKITDMSELFSHTYLKELDLSEFDTSRVTNMKSMFEESVCLEKLDIRNLNTKNVTDMNSMFRQCRNVKEIVLSSFDTSKVTDMAGMFDYCTDLEELDFSSFNTSRVKSMRDMFYYCKSLKNLDLSNFNTSNVKDVTAMFYMCYALKELNISNFDLSNAKGKKDMFYPISPKVIITTKDV